MRTTKEDSEGENDRTYEKQLPFIPRELGMVAFRFSPHTSLSWLPKVFASIEWHYTGFRYTSAENDPAAVLPSSGVAGLTCGADVLIWSLASRFVVSIQDLFNRDYEIMSGYPMPRRNSSVSFTIQF